MEEVEKMFLPLLWLMSIPKAFWMPVLATYASLLFSFVYKGYCIQIDTNTRLNSFHARCSKWHATLFWRTIVV